MFRPLDNGILMTDIVSYQPPFGLLGRFANFLFIRRQLDTIFRYREKALQKRFPHRNEILFKAIRRNRNRITDFR